MNGEKEAYICQMLLKMMETKKFFDINVTEFVNFAGISRSSFYIYFDSLYDVLDKIENEFMDGLLPVKNISDGIKSGRGKIDSNLISKTDYILRNKDMLRILMGENGDPSFTAKLTNRNRKILKESFKDSNYSEIEKRLLAEYISAGQIQAIKWWNFHEEAMDIFDVMTFIENTAQKLINETSSK